METTSLNFSKTDYQLVNFNIPKYLIKNFDRLVRFNGSNRTHMLIHFIKDYIDSEIPKLNDNKNLNNLINDISKNNRKEIKRSLKKEFEIDEPPMIPLSNDNVNNDWSNWEDRLKDL